MSKTALDAQNQYSATAAPSSPKTGDVYFNTVLNCLFVYNGASWDVVQKEAYATTATSASAVTLTAASPTLQFFTGSIAQSVVLPVVTTFPNLGYFYTIVNNSTNTITVTASGSGTVATIIAGTTWTVACILLTGTTNASWQAQFDGVNTITGTGSGVLATSPALTTPTATSPVFTASSAATIAALVKGFASQTADLLEIQTSAAAVLLSVTASGVLLQTQPVPNAQTTSATLTVANLLTQIITATSATAVALTLPTGTLMDGGFNTNFTNESFTWSIINLGSASGAVTLTAGTAHTIVGSATVAIGTSSLWRSVRTAAATWVTYRLV